MRANGLRVHTDHLRATQAGGGETQNDALTRTRAVGGGMPGEIHLLERSTPCGHLPHHVPERPHAAGSRLTAGKHQGPEGDTQVFTATLLSRALQATRHTTASHHPRTTTARPQAVP